MVPKNNRELGPREFDHELSTLYPYQIVEYSVEAYSFNGKHLMEPINHSYKRVFGFEPFEIISSDPTRHIEHDIDHASVWGVQLENIERDPTLDYDIDMIVYLNRPFNAKKPPMQL